MFDNYTDLMYDMSMIVKKKHKKRLKETGYLKNVKSSKKYFFMLY